MQERRIQEIVDTLDRIKAKRPALASRVERAEHILTVQLSVANGMRPIKVRRHADGTHTYIVKAGSKLQREYTVEAGTFVCTCPDATHRGAICKHGVACFVLETVAR
jgi:hypothetical protein